MCLTKSELPEIGGWPIRTVFVEEGFIFDDDVLRRWNTIISLTLDELQNGTVVWDLLLSIRNRLFDLIVQLHVPVNPAGPQSRILIG
ncbi:hypothetical protein RvY_11535 [Ramazzottius varieornatus]|uniref:Uncharacterized protein n=1 Tax=Ramazzottius varieornatus TaxID=947166 RepID=A0A1D1VQ96_RAMVA|nr:hypothetical protein RvY_11535 [Ramazzottius varieornatus]